MIREFLRASSIEEAVSLSRTGYVFLAGGTQVNSTPYKKWGKPVEKVLSLELLGFNEIKQEKKKIIIGSMVTLQELVDSPLIPDTLRRAASFIPTRSVRNIATIGGNVGANRPDSYIIPSLIVLGATAELADGRSLSVEKYVRGKLDDLIIRFILPPHDGISISIKESRSQLALPVVSAAISLSGIKKGLPHVVIAAGCVAPHCIRLKNVEKALNNEKLTLGSDLEEAIINDIHPKSDILGTSAYKIYINSVRIADALRFCYKELSL
jgi:putative selenate reductase FAD-binding subunit